ncbi:hypothetical protein HOG48_06420 [Candidatus Peregrinibacteria bacterium]|mgnify:CR=1 FL=1|jgi:hypothetical protein|nr:hypothetical protein [Candidatus Peregrinibacteria bacterium]
MDDFLEKGLEVDDDLAHGHVSDWGLNGGACETAVSIRGLVAGQCSEVDHDEGDGETFEDKVEQEVPWKDREYVVNCTGDYEFELVRLINRFGGSVTSKNFATLSDPKKRCLETLASVKQPMYKRLKKALGIDVDFFSLDKSCYPPRWIINVDELKIAFRSSPVIDVPEGDFDLEFRAGEVEGWSSIIIAVKNVSEGITDSDLLSRVSFYDINNLNRQRVQGTSRIESGGANSSTVLRVFKDLIVDGYVKKTADFADGLVSLGSGVLGALKNILSRLGMDDITIIGGGFGPNLFEIQGNLDDYEFVFHNGTMMFVLDRRKFVGEDGEVDEALLERAKRLATERCKNIAVARKV